MVRRIVALAGEGLGDRAVFSEPLRVISENVQRHESAFFRLAGEVWLAATEEDIHADAVALGLRCGLVAGIQHHADF